MQRDLDLIRALLLQIESGTTFIATTSEGVASASGVSPSSTSKEEARKIGYNLELIEEVGYAHFTRVSEGWYPMRITWQGHDFLDSVRDDEIWRKTKEGAGAAKGFTVELIAALAKGFLKKQIEDRTGIALSL